MKLRLLVALLLISGSVFAQGLDTLQLKTIFMEPFLPGARPSVTSFHPDGKHLIFSWNDSSFRKTEYFITDLAGKKTEEFKETELNRASTSPDGKWLVYGEKGDLWLSDIKLKNKTQLTKTKAFEFGARWSPDSKRIAFAQNGDIFVIDVNKPGFIQVTNKKEKDPGYSVSAWLGNDELIATQNDDKDDKEVFFPEYVGKFVKPGSAKRGISEIKVHRLGVDSTYARELHSEKGWMMSIDASKNGNEALWVFIDSDMKKYNLYVFNKKENTTKSILADSTKGWFHNSFTSARFSPNGDFILFESEASGWNHLYTIKADGSEKTQLTSGDYEVTWFDFLSNNELVIATSEVDLGERQVYTLDIKTKKQKRITTDEGFRKDFQLSADKKTLVYEKTIWNDPFDIFALNLKSGKEVRITNSTPERFKQINWQKPNYWRFTGRDGETKINMTMLKPVGFEEGKTYPVVVFVHGAGSLQNVYKGWSESYWREYMFHQYLTQQGYVVVEVDYRHSTGYGRKFREDVTNWMGKFETEDIIDGLDFAQKQTGILDLNRVGVYGGSYGGFMALYCVSVAPERFHAAAALRAVTNWENYYYANPWYTQARLGTPDKNPENYKRSSPLSFADTLKRPVYILHGLIDNNVGFQDAVQYVEKLIQSGNEQFEMMMYPSERHSFTDPDAWYDEYRRIYTFFERELK
ncbi:S9 family peptidase [bacterium]|nr:MAG: S9 family peptidase [bacterium]